MWGQGYSTYNKKSLTTTSSISRQQSTGTKPQNRLSNKINEADQINQFTKQDEEYFRYLFDRYIYGDQTKYSMVDSWRYKNPKDFRKIIYDMIIDIATKNQTAKNNSLIKERDFSSEIEKNISQFLSVLFKEMNTKRFDQTINLIQYGEMWKYTKNMQYEANKFCEQLKQIQKTKTKLDQMRDLQNKITVYNSIIQTLDSHKGLVSLLNYHKNQQTNVLEEKSLQKLIALTKKLDEDQKTLSQQKQLLAQYAPKRWLNHFLAILTQNFDEKKIDSLQKSVNYLTNNDESAEISMNAIKIHCLRKNKQVKFMEQLRKMKIQDYYTVAQARQFVKNTLELQLKRKFEEIFLKDLAFKIIESQNSKSFGKLETSYAKQICNDYFIKMQNKGFLAPQQSLTKQISINEDSNAQMIYLENNLQEINKLKAQTNTMKERIQLLQIQNAELNKLRQQKLQIDKKLQLVTGYNVQWQKEYQKQNGQIKKLKELVNQKEKELIDLNKQMENKTNLNKNSTIQVNKSKVDISQNQKQIKDLKEQNSKLQQDSNQHISSLEASIHQQQQEIQNLKTQVSKLESEIIQRDNLLIQKDSSIKQLQEEKDKNLLRILQCQKIMHDQEGQQKKINTSQIKIKQPEQQPQKSQQPKRVPKFKSFNTNEPRDKSAIMKPVSPKKTQIPTLKPQQKILDVLSTENIIKKLIETSIINKNDKKNIKELINQQMKLKFNQKSVAQTSISGKNLKPIQSSSNNQKLVQQDTLTYMENHSISQQEVIKLKCELQSQKKLLELKYSSQLNEKKQRIQQLQNQVSTLNQESQEFKSQIQILTNQLQKWKKEAANLTQSIGNLRQKLRVVPILEAKLQTMKKQKQNIQIKLKQIQDTILLQKHKSFQKQTEKYHTPSQSDEIMRLQGIVADKNKQIDQMNQRIQQISKQLSDSRDEKTKIVAQLENLQKKEKDINSAQIQKLEKENKDLNKKLINIQKELNEANQKVQKYEEELKAKPMSDQLKLKQQIIKKLEEQKKKIKTDNLTLELDLEQKTQHYNELREKYKKQTTTLKKKIQELNTANPLMQSEIENLKNQMKQKQQVLISNEEQRNKLKSQITQLQKSLQKSLQEKKLQSQRDQEQINQLKRQNQSNERQLQRLYEQKNKLESENESLSQKLRNEIKTNKEKAQQMKKDQQLQIKKLKLEAARQVDEIKKQIKTVEFAQKIKSTTETSSQSSSLLRLQHEKMRKELEGTERSKQMLQQSIDSLKLQVKQLKGQLNDKTKKLKQANDEVKFMEDSQKKLQKSLMPYQGGIKQMASVIYDRYFQNQALDQNPFKRYLLYDLIQQKTKRTIKKTKLLYSIDLLNKVNFHNYIDGKQNLLAVIKTTKGSIFGSFSTSKLERYFKQPSGTISFIYTFDTENSIEHFNIDAKKPLNVKAFDWDEFFFIFGNAEIRWRFGEKRIHSSFGITNAYYETKGKDVSILLRQGNIREVPMDELEFYQVEFEK